MMMFWNANASLLPLVLSRQHEFQGWTRCRPVPPHDGLQPVVEHDPVDAHGIVERDHVTPRTRV